jgi:hypothetical protein
MLINKITQTSVGADLSCTPPIYRPPVAFHNIQFILLKAIFAHTCQCYKYTVKCGQIRP